MRNLLSLSIIFLFTTQLSIGQHHYDDTFTAQRASGYTIDGEANESFWNACDWYELEYIWIPYGETMAAGDFSGRVKIAWTEEKLLIFAEIEDNELSDDHTDPMDNYWNDDCFEVFLDEDYSGGWHQNDNNAFAYHCAINEEDVIDIGGNFKDHVSFDLDTIDATHYTWELAITVYDDSYDHSSATNTTVTLSEGKEMGITMAYCDNDETDSRENFIGLMDLAEEHYNSAWQDADVFGKLTLVDEGTGLDESLTVDQVRIFFDKNQQLVIQSVNALPGETQVSVYDLNGRLMTSSSVFLEDRIELDVNDLVEGLYVVRVRGESFTASKLIGK